MFTDKKRLRTEKLSHAEASARERALYTEKLLHTEALRGFYTKSLHTETLTHRRVYTEESGHKDAFAHRSLYAQKLFCTK